jgi:hypothetical protein
VYVLGPSVIILKINDMKTSTASSSKPPTAVSFYPFLDKSSIGCSSSTVFDIVGFLSVVPDVQNKLVLATRIKQRWKISSMNKLLGNGEKIGKLFVNSRIIILERVRTSNTNFIHAINTSRTSIVFLKHVRRILCTNNYS